MHTELSRRSMMAAGTGALIALSARGAWGQPPGRSSNPEKPSKGEDQPGRNPAAGKPVSATAAAQEEGEPKVPGPPPRKLRLALVGLGKLMVGEVLPALRQSKECEVAALITGSPDKGRAIAAHLKLDPSRVIGYEAIAELDDSVDAVYIATPNAIHKRDALAAFKAGKHVLSEKPMATSVEDGEAMVKAAADAGRKLMVAYRVHHEPINNQVRRMLKEKKHGAAKFVVFDAVLDVGKPGQYRLQKALAGGGSLFDIGIYALNTTIWLLGEEPVEVTAIQPPSDDPRFKEVEGFIAFQLRFPSGCVANCTSSYGTARVNRYKIICEKGWIAMDPATSYRGLKGEHGDDDEKVTMKEPESVNQFAAEFDHFARCIREDTPVESPGEQGVRDIRLMHKIYEAARSGRTVAV